MEIDFDIRGHGHATQDSVLLKSLDLSKQAKRKRARAMAQLRLIYCRPTALSGSVPSLFSLLSDTSMLFFLLSALIMLHSSANTLLASDTDSDASSVTMSDLEDEDVLEDSVDAPGPLDEADYKGQPSTVSYVLSGLAEATAAPYNTMPWLRETLRWVFNTNGFRTDLCSTIRANAAVKEQWKRAQDQAAGPAQHASIQTSATTLHSLVQKELQDNSYTGINKAQAAHEVTSCNIHEDTAAFIRQMLDAIVPAYTPLFFCLSTLSLAQDNGRRVEFTPPFGQKITAQLHDQECYFFVTGLTFVAYRAAYETAFATSFNTQVYLHTQNRKQADMQTRELSLAFKKAWMFNEGAADMPDFASASRTILDRAEKEAHEKAAQAIKEMAAYLYAALLEIRMRLEPLLLSDSTVGLTETPAGPGQNTLCITQAAKASILIGIAAQLAPLVFLGNQRGHKKKVITPAEAQQLIAQEMAHQLSKPLTPLKGINPALAKQRTISAWTTRILFLMGDVSFINTATLRSNKSTEEFLRISGDAAIENARKSYHTIAATEEYLNALSCQFISEPAKQTMAAMRHSLNEALMYAQSAAGLASPVSSSSLADSLNAHLGILNPILKLPLKIDSPANNYAPKESATGLLVTLNQILWTFLFVRGRYLGMLLTNIEHDSDTPVARNLLEKEPPIVDKLLEQDLTLSSTLTSSRAGAGAPSKTQTPLANVGEQALYAQNALQFERSIDGALSHARGSVTAVLDAIAQTKNDLRSLKENMHLIMSRADNLIDAAITHAENVSALGAHAVENIKNTLDSVQQVVTKITALPGIGPVADKKVADLLAGSGAMDHAGEELKRNAAASAAQLARQTAALRES